MKIIAIRQPWAHLIVSGIKPVENRTWFVSYRGPLAILASQQWAHKSIESIEQRFGISIPRDLPKGGIVGVVDLIDIVQSHPSPYFSGPYGFVFANARAVPLIPMLGQLNIWDAPKDVAYALTRKGHARDCAYVTSDGPAPCTCDCNLNEPMSCR